MDPQQQIEDAVFRFYARFESDTCRPMRAVKMLKEQFGEYAPEVVDRYLGPPGLEIVDDADLGRQVHIDRRLTCVEREFAMACLAAETLLLETDANPHPSYVRRLAAALLSPLPALIEIAIACSGDVAEMSQYLGIPCDDLRMRLDGALERVCVMPVIATSHDARGDAKRH